MAEAVLPLRTQQAFQKSRPSASPVLPGPRFLKQEAQQLGTGRQGQGQAEVATTLVEMALQVSLPGTTLRDTQQVLPQ